MFGKEKMIVLSDSVGVALQGVQQALEILFGSRIILLGHVEIAPSKIGNGDGVQYRDIDITTRFRVCSDSSEHLYHGHVEMKKKADGEWKLDRGFPYIDMDKHEDRKPLGHFFIAHWNYEESEGGLPIVALADLFNYELKNHWVVGHTVADRHIEDGSKPPL